MPHTTLEHMIPFFGFIAWGDVMQLTVYRDKQGKMIWFPKTYPDKPASDAQLVQRQKLTTASNYWGYMNDAQREQWHLAARRASLCMHGYNLFLHWFLTMDTDAMRTLMRQTNTTLWPIPP